MPAIALSTTLRRTLLAIGLALAAAATPAPLNAQGVCGGPDAPCRIAGAGGGQYYVKPPRRWDGTTALPVLLFVHGYNATGRDMVGWRGVTRIAERGGFLFVAPDGLGKTWAHQGSPSNNRDEIAYFKALLADLERRFPIRRNEIVVSGFSQGGSMVWDLACRMGGRFKAFIPIAGGFWEPMPASCAAGPVDLLHIHGTQDRTVPLKGRPIGRSWRQADIRDGFAVWTKGARCSAAPKQTRRGKFKCEVWDNCATGKRLELCLHDGGHALPQGWGQEAFRFLRAVN